MASQQKISAPRGFSDVLPAESAKWQAVEAIAREVAAAYHFDEIRTPIMEESGLFHRGVGETSDIVHKETYTFDDRGGRGDPAFFMYRAGSERPHPRRAGVSPRSRFG